MKLIVTGPRPANTVHIDDFHGTIFILRQLPSDTKLVGSISWDDDNRLYRASMGAIMHKYDSATRTDCVNKLHRDNFVCVADVAIK